MAKWLKQSTAVTVVIGPFVDDTDFKTAETGLTIAQADVRLSKNAGAFAQKNDATTCTHMENGHYSCPLSTTDTNTLGQLRLVVAEAGALQVWDEYIVVPAHVYDGLIADTDKLQVDTIQVSGTAQTAGDVIADTNDIQARLPAALVGGRIDASVGAMAAGVVTAAAVATGAIDADALAADAVAEIADGVWDELKSGHTVPDSFGDYLDDEITSRAAPGDAMDLVAGAVDAAAIATGAVDADALATDAVQEIVNGVWNELKSAHTTPDSFGDYLDDEITSRAVAGDAMTLAAGAITAAAIAAGAITASKFAVDAIDDTVLSASACAEIADKLLGRNLAGGSDGGRIVADALRYLRNRVAISGGTMTVYQENDTTSAWTAAVTTAAGNPITEIDPA